MKLSLSENKRDLIFFILLAIGGGTIFKAMYLREVFYYPWNEYFSLNNTQSGVLMSWLGLVGVFSGALAGVIVDKFQHPKVILSLSYITMSFLAVWQSFKPSYDAMFVIIGLMSFVGNGLFLVSMTKIARLLASDNQQGRYFGFLESGRGIAGTLLTLCAIGIVSYYGSDSLSIGFILRFDASIYFFLGIISYTLIPEGISKIDNAEQKKLKDLLLLVKNKRLWLVSLSVACVIFVYQGAAYLVPYLTDAYGLTAEQAGIVGMVRAYFLAFVISPFAGVIADKLGSSLKVMSLLFVMGVITTISFVVVPHEASYLPLLIGLVLCLGAFTFGMRGIMYAQVSEIQIPKAYTGTAMGMLICIGFSPEAFVHLIYGYLLDNYAMEAYNYIFISMAVVLLLGAFICYYLFISMKKGMSTGRDRVSS
ncbi:MFS transporter [Vibrio sp. 10N.261.52.C2]|uniref:MFS transporter n=1 Tax=Vibrio sp. 10N.261.52.C2 TaxID=3229681 RepID=UPI00354F8FFC